MSEIKTSDLFEIKAPEQPGYRDINPEGSISTADAKAYWDEEFNSINDTQEDRDSSVNMGDIKDNQDHKLKRIEKNGFCFTIDHLGRTVSAEGELKITTNETDRNMPSMQSVGKGDQREGDQKGHLIARRFGAPDSIENLVPQDGKLNQGDYKKMENMLADAVNSGAEVYFRVEPQYEGNSNRPVSFYISYTIDGEKDIIVFKNESGDNNA